MIAGTGLRPGRERPTRGLLLPLHPVFPAVAVMQLHEQGRFELGDDVSDYLPFSVRNPNFPDARITFAQLLRHRSSIRDNMAFYGPEHLERLKLIKRLQHERFLPLKAIKAMLDGREEQFSDEQQHFLKAVRAELGANPQLVHDTSIRYHAPSEERWRFVFEQAIRRGDIPEDADPLACMLVVLGAIEGPDEFLAAVSAGVAGFCEPDAPIDAIVRTVESVRDSGVAIGSVPSGTAPGRAEPPSSVTASSTSSG